MKLRMVLALAILLAFSASATEAQVRSRLHKILESGQLRVGTTGDWNPMSIKDPSTNSYKGFDIDVMEALAKDMGVKIVFVPADWKTLINGIVADKYDVTTSASITPSRIRTVGFTQSYYQVSTVPVTLKSNRERFSEWEDMNRPDVIVAVTLGTSQEQQAREFFPNATIRSIEAPARDYQEVLSGRAMVSVTSNLEAVRLVQTYPELVVVPVSKPRKPADLAFIVQQEDMVWLNFLNHWITIKENEGFFDQLRIKWQMID